MTSRDFAYWLQGLFELSDPKTLNEHQTDLIKRHLHLVFKHEIDPSYTDDPEKQNELNAIHNATPPPIVSPKKPRPPFNSTTLVRC
jgi:hypothetical protein